MAIMPLVIIIIDELFEIKLKLNDILELMIGYYK
jgi:hypothetical protein